MLLLNNLVINVTYIITKLPEIYHLISNFNSVRHFSSQFYHNNFSLIISMPRINQRLNAIERGGKVIAGCRHQYYKILLLDEEESFQ